MQMPELVHVAMRPGWDCAACLQQWPCDPAREQMAKDTGGGTALATLCWVYLEEFALDAGPGPLKDAFERFIGWTRPAS